MFMQLRCTGCRTFALLCTFMRIVWWSDMDARHTFTFSIYSLPFLSFSLSLPPLPTFCIPSVIPSSVCFFVSFFSDKDDKNVEHTVRDVLFYLLNLPTGWLFMSRWYIGVCLGFGGLLQNRLTGNSLVPSVCYDSPSRASLWPGHRIHEQSIQN